MNYMYPCHTDFPEHERDLFSANNSLIGAADCAGVDEPPTFV